MLKHNRAIAVVMALVFCLSFLAPGLIAPSVAEAACTVSPASSQYVAAAAHQNLGYFKVELNVSDWTAPTISGSSLLVTYPTRIGNRTNVTNIPAGGGVSSNGYALVGCGDNFAAAEDAADGTTALYEATYEGIGAFGAAVGDSGVRIVIPQDVDNALNNGLVAPGLPATTEPEIGVSPCDLAGFTGAVDSGTGLTKGGAFTIILDPFGNGIANSGKDKGWFYVYFEDMDCSDFAGDVTVTLVPQSGSAFGSTADTKPVIVGKVQATKSTTTISKSLTKVTSSGAIIDQILITENMPGAITGASPVKLELVTKGYEWNNTPAPPAWAQGLFAFSAGGIAFGAFLGDTTDTATITAVPAAGLTTSGAIALCDLGITVDEKVAKVGQDIEVKVSGDGITEQTIVVGQYVDYVATVIEDTTTELTSGLDEQKIGTFFIEEVAPGTLIEDRTILFELPAGVEWDTAAIATSNYELANNSAMTFNGGSLLDARTLKFTVNTGSQNGQNGAKIKFKSLKVDVSPSFSGDVTLTVKGKAGVDGTAKVATVNKMITMNATSPEVNLGIKEQKVSDVEIVETKADTIQARINGFDQAMGFYLDDGFRFAKIPKVEVTEGDMVLEVKDVKIQAPANGQNLLIIPVRAASYKTPAKIKISEIYVTADRNAPVGDVVLYAADTSSFWIAGTPLCNAFNSTGRGSFEFDTPASVAIAKNVTVPPVENKGATAGGSGTFVIGSNIYTVNGLTKVMDTAPYIKNDRSFVPYRYLALAMGVAEADIKWDEAAQKVTVTKGTTVVEATIGSTTMTVNGEAKTMDVAPEISNGRTMLPARYLGEALGATVVWDPATKTVAFEI